MNAYQGSKFRMYQAVYSFLITNKKVWMSVPGYAALVEDFSNQLNTIISIAGEKDRNMTGVSLNTKNLKKELCQASLVISGTLVAIAAREKNFVMLKAMDFTPSQLEDLPAESLPPVCREIISNTAQYREALAEFNVTADTLAEFEQLVIQYELKYSAPRNAIVTRKTLGQLLKEAFAATDSLLKYQLDKVTQVYKKENRPFFNEYKYNRIIVNQGSRSTKITGHIKDSSSGEPLKNVLVNVDDSTYVTHSETDGSFVLKVPKTGPVKVVFELDGYTRTIMEEVELKLGKNTSLEVTMAREG